MLLKINVIFGERDVEREEKIRGQGEDRIKCKFYWISLFWGFHGPEWGSDTF